jgi:hypothetical protein
MDTLITSKNGLQNNKAVLYGQNENVVDGTEFIHNLDNYIHSLESGDVVRYCLYDKYSDIPQLGTISEFGIINSISITANQTKFMAIFACNNEYISKSEFLSADNSIQLSTIVKEDAFERLSNYYEEIYITVDPQKAQKIQNTKSGIKQPIFFCDALDEVHRNQTEKTPSIAEIKTDGDRYTGANISFGILGNNYVFNFKSINNYLIGNQRQGNYVFPVPYVVNRVTNSLGFKLKKIIDVYSFLTSYPILTSTEYLDDFDTIYEKQNGTFLKDESESINVTTQIQMKGLGNSRVFESFLQNSSLYKNTTRNGPLEWIPIDNLAVCLYESKQSQYSDLRNYVEQFNITDAVYSIENGILKCEITIGINIIDTSVYKYVSVINLSKNEFYFYVDEPLPEGYTNKLSIYFPIKG